MTGRRSFWDKSHDTDLIIKICDGLRPPIVTNAPEGYIELMQQCWHSEPMKRLTACEISNIFNRWEWDGLQKKRIGMQVNEEKNPTKIVESPDIGPMSNNLGAIYKSRPLSAMIKSTKSTINLSELGKRKFNENLIEEDNVEEYLTKELYKFLQINNNNKIARRTESFDNEYLTKELEFDIDSNIKF